MRPKTFTFQGRRYSYFNHPANNAGENERTIEIPIAKREVDTCSGSILEVGYVLRQYFPDLRHLIVDKYHPFDDGTIRKDVLDIEPDSRYSLIISISTLEHVGHLHDEGSHDPYKAIGAINYLRTLLSPRGKLFFTIPLGYNPDLDSLLSQCSELSAGYMQRVSADNCWKEVDCVMDAKYGEPYMNGNAILIGVFGQKGVIS